MISALYNIGIAVLGLYIRISSIWDRKSALWLNGRKNQLKGLQQWYDTLDRTQVFWFHCASLGEYEEARVFIELLQKRSSDYKFLISFFSPSGFENAKLDSKISHKIYLPLDEKDALAPILNRIEIRAFVLMKYDFWFNAIGSLHHAKIPIFLINSIVNTKDWKFRINHFSDLIKDFKGIWASDNDSYLAYQYQGFKNIYQFQDPRIARALSLKEKPNPLEDFFAGLDENLLVFGSIYKTDFSFIKEAMLLTNWSIIIAPHELELVPALMAEFPNYELRSELINIKKKANLIIWDSIGELKYIYKYATAVYIGGGLNKGLHNTFEAAVYHQPVMYSLNKNNIDKNNRIEGLTFRLVEKAQLVDMMKAIESGKIKEQIQEGKAYFDNFKSTYTKLIDKIENGNN